MHRLSAVLLTALLATGCTGTSKTTSGASDVAAPTQPPTQTTPEPVVAVDPTAALTAEQRAFKIAPVADGHSTVSGPLGFTGELRRGKPGAGWMLDGQFEFPTPGWSIGEPRTIMLKSWPERYVTTFPITPPPADAIQIQVIETKTVRLPFPSASEGATFNFHIQLPTDK